MKLIADEDMKENNTYAFSLFTLLYCNELTQIDLFWCCDIEMQGSSTTVSCEARKLLRECKPVFCYVVKILISITKINAT